MIFIIGFFDKGNCFKHVNGHSPWTTDGNEIWCLELLNESTIVMMENICNKGFFYNFISLMKLNKGNGACYSVKLNV